MRNRSFLIYSHWGKAKDIQTQIPEPVIFFLKSEIVNGPWPKSGENRLSHLYNSTNHVLLMVSLHTFHGVWFTLVYYHVIITGTMKSFLLRANQSAERIHD